jgi:hypothetical protein
MSMLANIWVSTGERGRKGGAAACSFSFHRRVGQGGELDLFLKGIGVKVG